MNPTHAACASLLLLSACASVGARVAEQSTPQTFVVVQNDRADDVSIYLEHNGVRTKKLGVARGFRSDTLFLTEADLPSRETVRFVSIGSTSAVVEQSNEATREPGALFRLHLGPDRGQSWLSVHYRPRGAIEPRRIWPS